MATNIDKFRLQVVLDAIYSNADDFNNQAVRLKILNQALLDSTLTDGTGSSQIKKIFRDQRTVSAASNDDIDLAGGLVDAFGLTITLTKLRMLLVLNNNTTAGDVLHIGAAGTNPMSTIFADTTDKLIVGPSGLALLYSPVDGYTVTGGSADVLRIRNPGANSISYNIYIAGTV